MAGMLNLLGADVGVRLVPASSDNEKGYWEHIDVAALNELALRSMGRSWKDVRPLPAEWHMSASARQIQRILLLILKRDFAGSALWALKDPRLCRLMPMWQGIFDALECEPVYIVMLRNPEEVWRSLESRDGISWEHAHVLWLQYMLDAEKWTRGRKRIFVAYDQLLEDWEGVLRNVEKTLGLTWPKDIGSMRGEIESFVSPSLRHHVASEQDTGLGANVSRNTLDVVNKTYALLQQAAAGKGIEWHKQLASVHGQFEELVVRDAWDYGRKVTVEPSVEEERRVITGLANSLMAAGKHVELVFPATNSLPALRECADALYDKISGPNTELVIVDNKSRDREIRNYLVKLKRKSGVRVVSLEEQPFDIALISKPELQHVYICAFNVGVSEESFQVLAQYGELDCFFSACGPNMVLAFGRG
jgi:hypothetical protein